MRRFLRTILIGVMVVTMSFNPASAWYGFRSGRGGYGGYYSGYGGYGDYYGGYGGGRWGSRYSSGYGSHYGGGSGCCGSYGYSSAGYGGYGGYDSCGGGCGGCDSCGSSYGGYDSCGGGCDSCGGYDGYSDGSEVIVDHGTAVDSYDRAPAPPVESTTPRTVPAPEEPSGVQRPMDTTPVPALPPEPMPGATEPAPPAETPAEEPDDLFGPATTPPAEMTPPAETTPPAEEPADDLFGTPSTESTTPPAETPTTPPQTEPATPPADVDDLFGPASTSTETTPPAGTESTPPTEEAIPPAGTEEATDAAEDLFGTSYEILREPGGLASGELRTWVDNTGKYSCHGRLVRFLDNHVRLLKDNGRTTTVPLARLSANDMQFVQRQASAQQTEMVSQLAQSLSTMPVLAY